MKYERWTFQQSKAEYKSFLFHAFFSHLVKHLLSVGSRQTEPHSSTRDFCSWEANANSSNASLGQLPYKHPAKHPHTHIHSWLYIYYQCCVLPNIFSIDISHVKLYYSFSQKTKKYSPVILYFKEYCLITTYQSSFLFKYLKFSVCYYESLIINFQ